QTAVADPVVARTRPHGVAVAARGGEHGALVDQGAPTAIEYQHPIADAGAALDDRTGVDGHSNGAVATQPLALRHDAIGVPTVGEDVAAGTDHHVAAPAGRAIPGR